MAIRDALELNELEKFDTRYLISRLTTLVAVGIVAADSRAFRCSEIGAPSFTSPSFRSCVSRASSIANDVNDTLRPASVRVSAAFLEIFSARELLRDADVFAARATVSTMSILQARPTLPNSTANRFRILI